MGNRMMRESLLESDKISALSDFDFRLWVALILLADDYGVVDARPAIIKGRGFPLRERVTIKDISEGLRRLTAGRCVTPYTSGGRPYVQFSNWSDHQRVRDSKHRYPTIDEADAESCRDSPQVAASCRKPRPEPELEPEPQNEPEGRSARARTRFIPPSVDEAQAYATEKGWESWRFDAQGFVDYFASVGWKVGKSQKPMSDWRAAARRWAAKQERPDNGKRSQSNPALNYEQREYRDEDFGEDFFVDLDRYGEE